MAKDHPVAKTPGYLATWRSFGYALAGLRYIWQTQRNFRLESLLGLMAITLALLFNVNLTPILLCCALVLSLEALNTALEAVVDLASPAVHPLARVAKDAAAAAVLLAAGFSLIIGLLLLLPPLLRLVFSTN
jgi:diacylglycerol kinase (ATP)